MQLAAAAYPCADVWWPAWIGAWLITVGVALILLSRR